MMKVIMTMITVITILSNDFVETYLLLFCDVPSDINTQVLNAATI